MSNTHTVEILQPFTSGGAVLRVNGAECTMSSNGRFSRFADWLDADKLVASGAATRKVFRQFYGHTEYYATPALQRAVEAAKAAAVAS